MPNRAATFQRLPAAAGGAFAIAIASASPAAAQDRESCPVGAPGAPAVYIDSSVSEVTVVTPDGQRFTASQNLLLCPGDEVQTGGTGRVAIRFDEKRTVVRLDGNSRTRVLSGGTGDGDVSLTSGVLYFLSSVRQHFQVETPYIVAGIDGTEALVAVQPAGSLAMAAVREGLVHAFETGGDPASALAVAEGEAAFRSASTPLRAAPIGDLPPPFQELLIASDSAVDWAVYYPPIMLARNAAEPAVREALRLLTSGDYERAAAALAGASTVDPAATAALLTIIAVARNRLDEAERWSAEALAADPNFASAHIAASYLAQAKGDLGTALAEARNAQSLAPGDAYAAARVAELEMTIGDRRAALKSAEQALSIERTPLALFVAGLARLAASQYERAGALFDEAIALDPEAPLPRLGRGLLLIRQGRTADGTWEIERAVAHDPNRAALRTWLGRAYFDEGLRIKAAEQLRLAKEADPEDPTPYLFAALERYAANDPIGALRELEAADERGDARRVLRSAQGLGEDAATRGAAEGRIYGVLGLEQLAIVKGTEAVDADQRNPGAHRFLAEAYRSRPDHEIAQASELLRSQLLSPPSKTPVQPQLVEPGLTLIDTTGPSRIAFAEFSPLFDADGVRADLAGLLGTQATVAEEATLTALYRNASVSVGQFHYETDGYRENNDVTHDIYNAIGTFAPTPEVSFFGEYRLRETEAGDRTIDFDIDDYNPTLREDLRREVARAGFHLRPSVDADLIGVYTWATLETDADRDAGNIVFEAIDEAHSGQLQYNQAGDRLNAVLGAAYIHDDKERLFNGNALQDDLASKYGSAYAYFYLDLPTDVTWTLGGSFVDYHETDGDPDITRFLPKAGVRAALTPWATIRAAYIRTLKPDLVAEQLIEPTAVAGFNQLYDGFNGSVLDQFGAGIDLKLGTLQLGGEYVRQDWDVPTTGDSQDMVEDVFRAYAFLPLGNRWAFVTGFSHEDSDGEEGATFQDWRTDTVPIRLAYFDPSGFYGDIQYDRVEHRFRDTSNQGKDSFGILNASLGWRLPNERGLISASLLNVLDEDFHFQNRTFRPDVAAEPRYAPSRTILLQGSFRF